MSHSKSSNVFDSDPPDKPTEFENFLKEISSPDSAAFSGHLIEHVVEEIALEGLDGITLQALKVRLANRPNLEIEDFEDVAPALWNQMKTMKCLSFHCLPIPRADLRPYRWDKVKDERGSPYEPLHAPEEIYPYFPVEDKSECIRGSCETFKTRKDISHLARRMTYQDAIKHLGNNLVIVADQITREKCLLGENYKKYQSLSIVQYCIMERVGRARHAGETTRGKVSFQCLNIQPKTLFYNRKALLKAGILTKQSASMKYANCKCPAQITVFHLPRMYRRVESMANLHVRQIFSSLNNSPSKSIPVETVVKKYGKHTMRNIMNQFPMLVETRYEVEVLPDTEENENEDDELLDLEVMVKKRKPRTLRVLGLKQADIQLQTQILQKVLEGESVEEENTEGADEEKEENVNVNTPNSFSDIKALRSEHVYSNISDTCLLYRALLRAGDSGLKQTDLTFLKMTSLEARSAIRNIVRHNLCKEGIIKMQKQKAFTYTFSKFANFDIKLHLQDDLENVLEQIKKLRKTLYEQKTGTKLPSLKSLALTDSLYDQAFSVKNECIEEPQHDEMELDQESVVQAPPSPNPNPQKQSKTKGKKMKEPNSNPKSKSLRPMPLSKKLKKKANQNDVVEVEVQEDRSRILSQAIENIPTPSLCLVTPLVDLKKELSPGPPPHTQPSTSVKNLGTINSTATATSSSNSISIPAPTPRVTEQPRSLQGNSEEGIEEDEETGLSKVDQVDEEIRRKMVRQRVDWKPGDDRFILLAFIASILFIPKYNFSKIFIFNSVQIRDLMLKKSRGVSNKTSSAIRRRVHFLMNQKESFYESWISLLNAAVRDTELYENILKLHFRPPQRKIYFTVQDDALERVYDYLDEKYDQEDYFCGVDIRGSLSVVESLLFLRQLKRAEFYWNAMMFIIFCPMGNCPNSRRRFRVFWRNYVVQSKKKEMGLALDPMEIFTLDVEGQNENEAGGGDPVAIPVENVRRNCTEGGKGGGEEEPEVEEDVEDEEEEEEELDEDKRPPEELYIDYVTKYFKFLVKQLKIMFGTLLMLGSTSKKRFQLVTFDPRVSRNVCNSGRECNSSAEVKLWTARCIVLDLVFSGDPSRSVEKPVLKNIRLPIERAAKSLTHARILVSRKKTGLIGVARVNLRQFVCGLPSNAFDETVDFLEYIEEVSKVDSMACISPGILYGIVELTDYFQPDITVTESVFTLNEEWVPVFDGIAIAQDNQTEDGSRGKPSKKRKRLEEEEEGQAMASAKRPRKELTEEEQDEIEDIMECFEELERDVVVGKKSRAPSIGSDNEMEESQESRDSRIGLEEGNNFISSSTDTLRLLRIRLNQAGVEMSGTNFTGFVERDFFSINLPTLEFVFPKRSGLNREIHGSKTACEDEPLKELRKSLVELVYHSIPEEITDEEKLQNLKLLSIEDFLRKYELLFEVISFAGNLGVSSTFLMSKFERKSLGKGLRYLLEAKLIFSVGITVRRFVSYNNVGNWIIPIRRDKHSLKVGHVIMRPWITPLGGLSWSTINRLLISLLGQFQKPEMAFDELCEVFNPTLSRVEVMVLIEALVKLKYVTIYRLEEQKATMFSKPKSLAKSVIEYHADTLLETEGVFVAVSPYTTFLHAQLQNAIVQTNRVRSKLIKKKDGSATGDKQGKNKGTRKKAKSKGKLKAKSKSK